MLLRSDDEQTEHNTHMYKTMIRRIEPTERCYEERLYEGLSTMDNATKRRETYEMDIPTVLGLAASHPASRLPSGTPVEGGQQSLIRIFLPASISTRRRTEDEAGSPRVADRSGAVAVLSSSPLVLHERYTMTGTN